MLIRTKAEYVALAQAGKAGNCTETWNSPEEFLANPLNDSVGIRLKVPGSKKFTPFVPRNELLQTIAALDLQEGEYYLSENVKPDETILAGELGWANGGWVFFFSHQRTDMRTALAESGRHMHGMLTVFSYIRAHCVGTEWDDLMSLFDTYTVDNQYPVIELSFTTVPHGIRQQRMLIWEVRHY